MISTSGNISRKYGICTRHAGINVLYFNGFMHMHQGISTFGALVTKASCNNSSIKFLNTHTHTIVVPQILRQPANAHSKPGETVEFSLQLRFSRHHFYQWYFNRREINNEDMEFEGSTSECLVLTKCLSKHKGFFQCVVTNEFGVSVTSEVAELRIGIQLPYSG